MASLAIGDDSSSILRVIRWLTMSAVLTVFCGKTIMRVRDIKGFLRSAWIVKGEACGREFRARVIEDVSVSRQPESLGQPNSFGDYWKWFGR